MATHSSIDQFAVIGHPIEHSKSPLIHQMFAEQTAQTINYTKVLAPLDGFQATVASLIAQGLKGANVTVPFKFEAFAMCDHASPQAAICGAVNTLVFTKDGIIGHNTDGDGLVRDITVNHQQIIQHKRVLLLGAGGAAEGVVLPILNQSPASLVIANRTISKADNILRKYPQHQAQLEACTFADLFNQTFDIIINATSTGLSDTALPIPDTVFSHHCLAYDMMYGKQTPFMQQAKSQGANIADGLGMLIEQAAIAFEIWQHKKPNTHAVIQHFRQI